MIRAIFFIQCDVCGDFFEQIETGLQPNTDRNDWALHAGNLLGTATQDGWFFNPKTRKHWCLDCLCALHSD
jgi:hypothetical protein